MFDSETIQTILKNLEDTTPLMRRFGEELLLSTEERFNRETTPSGQPWPPLSEDYKQRKENDSILTETGQMSEQIGYDVVGESQVKVGGTRPDQQQKMHVHNFGYSGQVDGHTRTLTHAFGEPLEEATEVEVDSYHLDIPQRKFLGLPDDYIDRLKLIAEQYVLDDSQRNLPDSKTIKEL